MKKHIAIILAIVMVFTVVPVVTVSAATLKAPSLMTFVRGDVVESMWMPVKGAKGYQLYRSTSKNGKYSRIATTTKTEHTDYLANFHDHVYYYKARAYKSVKGKTQFSKFGRIEAVDYDSAPDISISMSSKSKKTRYITLKVKNSGVYGIDIATNIIQAGPSQGYIYKTSMSKILNPKTIYINSGKAATLTFKLDESIKYNSKTKAVIAFTYGGLSYFGWSNSRTCGWDLIEY